MNDKDISRRGFFKYTLLEIVKGVKGASSAFRGESKKRFLRPPGAVEETLFLSLCKACDECIKACPALCIRGADSEGLTKIGTPIIIPSEAPCVICSDLSCIKVCEYGALKPVEDVRHIKMGIPVVDNSRCLNYQKEEIVCKECYLLCPFKDEAIHMKDYEGPEIDRDICAGCGICEYVCGKVIGSPAIVVEGNF